MKKLQGENDIEEALRRLDRLTRDRTTADLTEETLRLNQETLRLNQEITQETLSVVKRAKRGLFPIGNALIDDWGTEFDLQLRGY